MLFPLPPIPAVPPRVVVTGAGIITALGSGWPKNALGFRNGQSAFKKVSLFDVSRQRVQTAAEIELPAHLPATQLTARAEHRLDRASRLLLMATHEAWTQASWGPDQKLPLVLGTTSGGMNLGQDYYRAAIDPQGRLHRQPTRVVQYQAQAQALTLADAFDFSGPVTIIANACASGANAIGHAWELIRTGQATRVLTGGYDALSQLVFAGFDSLQALSTTQCRPFDAQRDGLALGEGAAMLTLETLESAQAREATILGEIIGYGAATDVYHLTQPHPQGNAAIATMTAACQAAGCTPTDIDYVNAHGTGTPLNDSAEAAAISQWAGERAATLPVSSTKASIGHLLGAAGAVEAVICLMTLREQWLPPNLTTGEADTACKFPLVRLPTGARVDCVLTNSFGFGGANASLVLRRWAA